MGSANVFRWVTCALWKQERPDKPNCKQWVVESVQEIYPYCHQKRRHFHSYVIFIHIYISIVKHAVNISEQDTLQYSNMFFWNPRPRSMDDFLSYWPPLIKGFPACQVWFQGIRIWATLASISPSVSLVTWPPPRCEPFSSFPWLGYPCRNSPCIFGENMSKVQVLPIQCLFHLLDGPWYMSFSKQSTPSQNPYLIISLSFPSFHLLFLGGSSHDITGAGDWSQITPPGPGHPWCTRAARCSANAPCPPTVTRRDTARQLRWKPLAKPVVISTFKLLKPVHLYIKTGTPIQREKSWI